jgi:RNA polymerase sigma-70 factor (ECF subfamily)
MVKGEEELIRQFQSGETEAFDRIMKLLEGRALSVAYYWTGHREDALDLVQEAFVRLYKFLPSWKPRASLFTWLYRVIVNLAHDRGRKLSQNRKVDLDDLPPLEEKGNRHHPSSLLLGKEAGKMVAAAVAMLPPRQKAVFILRHYQDLSLKEIARIQRCSLGAVKANLFQALQKLRLSLNDYYK